MGRVEIYMEKKNRDSNFEILRIIAIFMIVSFHCAYHSGFIYANFSTNVFVVKSFYLLGELGVNLFFLISGFFQINGKVKPKKIILLFGELIFYIIVSKLIATCIKGNYSFSALDIFKSCITPSYWFFIVYMLIYIFSPYINSFIKNLSKLQLATFLFLSYFIYSILPTILGLVDGGETEKYYFFSRLIWGFIIYCTGAFISINRTTVWCSVKKNIIVAVTSFSSMLFFILLVGKVGIFSKIGLTEPAFFWQINTVPMLMLSISTFNLFRLWKINKSWTIINYIASTTLGIYLLHDGELRLIIWDSLFNSKVQLSYSSLYSLLYIVLASLVIIIIGAVIDLIRQIIEKFTIVKLMDALKISKFKNLLEKYIQKIFS